MNRDLVVADTAFSIAVVRAEESERPEAERLFEDPYARLFAAEGAHAAEATKRFVELPYFREGVRLRTRFIDDSVRQGLAAGLTQVVLLGAGFDARALRMPEIAASGAKSFEVDTADQLERKRRALTAARVKIPERVVFVPFEFASPDLEVALAAALAAKGFRLGAGAIFVWEGVIGYIDSETIDRTLRFIANTGGRSSRLVFTFADVSLEPVDARTRIERAGFTSFEEVGTDALWRRHFGSDPPAVMAMIKLGVAIV